MGDFEIAFVDGQFDGCLSAGVYGGNIGAITDAGLHGAQIVAGYRFEQLFRGFGNGLGVSILGLTGGDGGHNKDSQNHQPEKEVQDPVTGAGRRYASTTGHQPIFRRPQLPE